MGKKKKTVYKPPKKNNKGFIILIGVIFVVAAVLLFIISNQEAGKQDTASGGEGTQIDVSYEGQPTIGEEDAPVKLVEFFDFQCPHCASFAQQVYPMIKKDFIDTGKASMTLINKPFLGPDSKTAALIGEAVYAQKPEAFFAYYDAVLANQGEMNSGWANEESLLALVESEVDGIDLDQLKKDLDSDAIKQAVEQDVEMSAPIESTPTILVNGKLVGLEYETSIKPAIEEALEEANEQ
ncbi:DsbA family protein [Pseudalkalibacillus sp. SCS-8]|uniref:DsbA family protein n=1 Tax=Pseudalkalibacillus nanhaiensis TaxID=3115291 RepID=UPI0032DA14F0